MPLIELTISTLSTNSSKMSINENEWTHWGTMFRYYSQIKCMFQQLYAYVKDFSFTIKYFQSFTNFGRGLQRSEIYCWFGDDKHSDENCCLCYVHREFAYDFLLGIPIRWKFYDQFPSLIFLFFLRIVSSLAIRFAVKHSIQLINDLDMVVSLLWK